MHSDQLDLDDDVARTLIVRELPHVDAGSIERVRSTGTVNAIFRVGNNLTARFPLQMSDDPVQARHALELEAAALAEFASVSPFAAPELVAVVAAGKGYPMPWAVQTWVDGDAMTPVSVAGVPAVAEDLGKLLLALRATPVGTRLFRGEGRGGDLEDQDKWVQHCLREIAPFMDPQPLRRLWKSFRALPAGRPHVMTHSDLTPSNLLAANDRLVGVLDAGWFGPADPSLDLVCAWHLFDEPARSILRDAVRADDLEWERGAAWAFVQAMGLVWCYHSSNPAMALLGKSTLQRLLTGRW